MLFLSILILGLEVVMFFYFASLAVKNKKAGNESWSLDLMISIILASNIIRGINLLL